MRNSKEIINIIKQKKRTIKYISKRVSEINRIK